MHAVVLTIGDEILIGQIVNSNAAWIGEQLTGIGVRPLRMLTVGDEEPAISRAMSEAMHDARVVIVTGGLGPTHDDITRDVTAAVFGVPLEQDDRILAQVRERFERRGWEMPPSNVSQAMVPRGFEAISNPAGTAPALIGSYDHEDGPGVMCVLPGVPFEMRHFMEEAVVPRIQQMDGAPQVVQKTLLTAGIGESHLVEQLDGVEALLTESLSLAFLPNLSTMRLRLTGVDSDRTRATAHVARLEAFIRERAEQWIYGEGNDTLEAVVGRQLTALGWTIGTAESCTGGALAHRLTNTPGASAYVEGGVVSYSNAVKTTALGVQPSTIEVHGAVSRQTACEMAEGVRERLGVAIGISTTGILGPDGGTEDKPVGTIWIGISTPRRTSAVKLMLGTNRARNKDRATTAALNLIWKELRAQTD